jgi:hypothetical protein
MNWSLISRFNMYDDWSKAFTYVCHKCWLVADLNPLKQFFKGIIIRLLGTQKKQSEKNDKNNQKIKRNRFAKESKNEWGLLQLCAAVGFSTRRTNPGVGAHAQHFTTYHSSQHFRYRFQFLK